MTSFIKGLRKTRAFIELVRKRQPFAWLLSLITLVLYVGFILLIAFDPQWLGTPIAEGSSRYPWDSAGHWLDRDLFCTHWDVRHFAPTANSIA